MLDRDRPLFRCWVIDGCRAGGSRSTPKTHRASSTESLRPKKLYDGLSLTDEPTVLPPACPNRTAAGRRINRHLCCAGSPTPFVSRRWAINQISFGVTAWAWVPHSAPISRAARPSWPAFADQRAAQTGPQFCDRIAAVGGDASDRAPVRGHTQRRRGDRHRPRGFARLPERGDYDHEFIAMVRFRCAAKTTAIGTRVSAMSVRLGSPGADIMSGCNRWCTRWLPRRRNSARCRPTPP